jgi:hypothetical protein
VRKTYRVHLRGGTTIKFKADDFIWNYDENGCTEWKAPNVNRWFSFHPNEFVAVERLR